MKKARKERKFTTIRVKINGNTHCKSVSYRTVSELAEKRKAFEEDLQRKFSKKFSDVADRWQEEHDETIETYTQSCYKAPVKDLKNQFGDLMMSDIDSLVFQSFLDRLAKQGYAKQTIRLRKIAMKQIFDYAIAHQLVMYNPIPVCKIPKKANKGTTRLPPSESDIERIKANSDGVFGMYCNFLLYTGLRKEEALPLTFDDIDFENKTISVSKVLVFNSNVPTVRHSTKSDAGTRIVPLLAPAEVLLLSQKTEGLLFPGKNGLMTKGEFDKGFERYKKQSGISCTSHQLRHYFATICFDAELAEKDVQDIMGHSRISLTHDIYTHIRKQRKKDSVDKLNRFLSGGNITA